MDNIKYRLEVGEIKPITIIARQFLSTSYLEVAKDEIYEFLCDENQTWRDSFVLSTPNGYYNPAPSFLGLRVKNTLCFCLCAQYDNRDSETFAIGSYRKITVTETGVLNFFANDTKWFYFNNKGKIILKIKRIN